MIKFTDVEGSSVYVNPNRITYVRIKDGRTFMFFGADDILEVKEIEDEVVSKIYGTKFNTLTRTGNYDRL